MYEYLLRRSNPCGHEHGLPHSRLLTQIVFAGKLQARPPLLETSFFAWPVNDGNIIYQCIEPHIHDMLVVARHRHTPRKFFLATTNTEIFETHGHE